MMTLETEKQKEMDGTTQRVGLVQLAKPPRHPKQSRRNNSRTPSPNSPVSSPSSKPLSPESLLPQETTTCSKEITFLDAQSSFLSTTQTPKSFEQTKHHVNDCLTTSFSNFDSPSSKACSSQSKDISSKPLQHSFQTLRSKPTSPAREKLLVYQQKGFSSKDKNSQVFKYDQNETSKTLSFSKEGEFSPFLEFTSTQKNKDKKSAENLEKTSKPWLSPDTQAIPLLPPPPESRGKSPSRILTEKKNLMDVTEEEERLLSEIPENKQTSSFRFSSPTYSNEKLVSSKKTECNPDIKGFPVFTRESSDSIPNSTSSGRKSFDFSSSTISSLLSVSSSPKSTFCSKFSPKSSSSSTSSLHSSKNLSFSTSAPSKTLDTQVYSNASFKGYDSSVPFNSTTKPFSISPCSTSAFKSFTTAASVTPPKNQSSPTPVTLPKKQGSSTPVTQLKKQGSPTPVTQPKKQSSPTPVTPPKKQSSPTPVTQPKKQSSPTTITPPKKLGSPTPVTPPKKLGSPTPVTPPKKFGFPIPVTLPKKLGSPVHTSFKDLDSPESSIAKVLTSPVSVGSPTTRNPSLSSFKTIGSPSDSASSFEASDSPACCLIPYKPFDFPVCSTTPKPSDSSDSPTSPSEVFGSPGSSSLSFKKADISAFKTSPKTSDNVQGSIKSLRKLSDNSNVFLPSHYKTSNSAKHFSFSFSKPSTSSMKTEQQSATTVSSAGSFQTPLTGSISKITESTIHSNMSSNTSSVLPNNMSDSVTVTSPSDNSLLTDSSPNTSKLSASSISQHNTDTASTSTHYINTCSSVKNMQARMSLSGLNTHHALTSEEVAHSNTTPYTPPLTTPDFKIDLLESDGRRQSMVGRYTPPFSRHGFPFITAEDLTPEELHAFDMRWGSPHHGRGRKGIVRPTLLALPANRPRVTSLPNRKEDREEEDDECYRLRHFSITGRGVVNRGDSFKSKRSRSNNSVASDVSRRLSIFDSRRSLTPPSITTPQITLSCEDVTRINEGWAWSQPCSLATSAASSAASSRASSASESAFPFRVVMLGAAGVGKTTLCHQFMTSEHINAYDNSLDDEYGEKSVSIMLDGEESEIQLIDHPADEMSVENYLATYNPHAIVVVFSVIDRQSFVRAEEIIQYLWRLDVMSHKGVILVGNKTDLVRSRCVTLKESSNLADSYDCKFIETSSGLNHQVDELLVGVVKQIRLKIYNPEVSREVFRKRSTRRKKYRGTKTSASLKVKSLLTKVCGKELKSKSCENLHVL